MKVVDGSNDFDQLVGEYKNLLSTTKSDVSETVSIARALFGIVEEKKNTNLLFHQILQRLDSFDLRLKKLEQSMSEPAKVTSRISSKDEEVLNYVRENGLVSAEDMAQSFGYKGKNAASARLSKLFHEGHLKKEYTGRNVLYKIG